MQTYYFILVFILGCVIGSFLNVVIYRLPRQRSLIKPSSRCGICRSSIAFWMNIPLVSYLISAGRCSKCGSVYSARYFVVELLTGLLFLAVASIFGFTIEALIAAFFVCLMIVASFVDLELRIIPDEISLGAWGVFLVLALLGRSITGLGLVDAIIGSAVGYLSFWILSRAYYLFVGEEGLGGGDVKFMGLIGAALGIKAVLSTVLFASVTGAVMGILMILILGKGRRFPIPFGPFLAMGALVSLFSLDIWWRILI